MYCVYCKPHIKPKWLVDYAHNKFAKLLCTICSSDIFSYYKLLTYDEFVIDQYLAQIVCEDIKYVYYTNNRDDIAYLLVN